MVYGILRGSDLDFEGPVEVLRTEFDELLTATPLPEHVQYSNSTIAADGVEVDLQVRPRMPHVFPSFAGLLPEGERALVDFGRFVAGHTA